MDTHSGFAPAWFLLQQEGTLIRACLCSGLTSLRQANVGEKKGAFYLAFFELSIGLERMMKLIIVLDHMCAHGLAAPSARVLRNYGHQLSRLLAETRRIAGCYGVSSLDDCGEGTLRHALLTFLDSFARSAGRYANLELLANAPDANVADPLIEWRRLATRLFNDNATPTEHGRAAMAGHAAGRMRGAIVSLIADLDQRHPSAPELQLIASELDVSAKYAVLELVSLVAALRNVLEAVTDAAVAVNQDKSPHAAHVPFMHEFFGFALIDRRDALAKRRWP